MKQLSLHLTFFWSLVFLLWAFILTLSEDFKYTFIEVLRSNIARAAVGILAFSIGIYNVIFHNIWELDFRLIVTICGWVAMISGGLLTIFSGYVNKVEAVLTNKHFNYILALFLIVGSFLYGQLVFLLLEEF